jgi:hypothetical protein
MAGRNVLILSQVVRDSNTETEMKNVSKIAATVALSAALLTNAAVAGGLSDTEVESEVLVAETKPAGSLRGKAPLILLAVVGLALAAGGGSSDGTN